MSENTNNSTSIDQNIPERNLFRGLKKIPTIKDHPATDWSTRHEIYADLSQEEIEILSVYNKLSDDKKEEVLNFILSIRN